MEDNREERVQHPSHYTWLKDVCGVEVIDITRHLDFDLGNVVKYVLRAGHKREAGLSDIDKTIEDLRKAEFYLNDEIKLLKHNRDVQYLSTFANRRGQNNSTSEEGESTCSQTYDGELDTTSRTFNYTRDDITD